MAQVKTLESKSEMQDFMGGISVNEIRQNSSLPKDAWEQLDQTVVEAAEGPLVGVQDIRDAGLTNDINFGTTDHQYQQTNKFSGAETSLSGEAEGEGDDTQFDLVSNPVPVIFKDYTISKRRLSASQEAGISIDDSNASEAGRSIARKMEDMLFNGDSSIQIGSDSLEGYTDHVDAIDVTSGSPSTSGDWGGTPGNIFDDKNVFIERLQTQSDDNGDTVGYMGPYWLYLSVEQWNETKVADPEGDGNLTSRERLRDDMEIDAIRATQALADGDAVMVHPTRQVVDMSIAQDLTTVTMSEDTFTLDVRTFAIAAPRVKSDKQGVSGVAEADNL